MISKKVTTAVGRTALKTSYRTVVVTGRVAVKGMRLGIRRSQRFPHLPAVPQGHYVDLPGRGSAYVVDTGAPHKDAPTLLLFHGLATTAHLTWFSTIDHLRQDHRVVMFDQRWHGRGIMSETFDLGDCADDGAAILDHLGVDQVIAVGYSMGGALAQVFWNRHPERVEGLLLASTAMSWKSNRGDRMFYPILNFVNTKMHSGNHSRVSTHSAARSPHPCADSDMSTFAWGEFRATSAWSMPVVLGALGDFDATEWMKDVTVPAAVVVTAKDHAIPAPRQRFMAATIPGAKVFESPGGHASVVFDVERWRPVFLSAVADVVRRVRSADSTA